MRLKGRLEAIAEKIPGCGTLADIGTDHAYIPIYAVMKGICSKALATDVRIGPVKIAERNVMRYCLQDKIQVRLGYGLEPLEAGEADVVVIAGMGGPLICEILTNSPGKSQGLKLLILQPMNAIETVRKRLNESGFKIYEEVLASEGEKVYNVICAGWTGSTADRDDYDYYVGRELLESGDPLLRAYLGRKLGQLNVIIEGMDKSNAGRDDELEGVIMLRERLAADLRRLEA